MPEDKTTYLLLRIGVAFAFIYPPIDTLFDPYSWLGYFPKFMHGIVPDMLLLNSFGLVEAIIALWILSGNKIFIPSSAATLMLIGIILFNLADFQIVFRDVPIAFMSSALALREYGLRKEQNKQIK